MDTIGTVVTVLTLVILGLASILSLLAREIGWPKGLVRHFAELKRDEYRQVLAQVVEEQARIRERANLERTRAIEEAGRYEAPADRMAPLVKASVQQPDESQQARFAAEVPFFVDFMSSSMDDKFTDECSLILASHLRFQRSDLAFDYIVGIKNGSPLIAAALAKRLKRPLLLHRGRVRPKRDRPDVQPVEAFDGDYSLLSGRALIVDDSTTGGSMVIDCANDIRDCGGGVAGALVLFEVAGRRGNERLRMNGIPFFPVIRVDKDYIASLNA